MSDTVTISREEYKRLVEALEDMYNLWGSGHMLSGSAASRKMRSAVSIKVNAALKAARESK